MQGLTNDKNVLHKLFYLEDASGIDFFLQFLFSQFLLKMNIMLNQNNISVVI